MNSALLENMELRLNRSRRQLGAMKKNHNRLGKFEKCKVCWGTKMKNYKAKIEEYLGRKLVYGETVHHINMNKRDNNLSNLYIFSWGMEHSRYHSKLKYWLKQNSTKKIIDCPFYILKSNLDKYKKFKGNEKELKLCYCAQCRKVNYKKLLR